MAACSFARLRMKVLTLGRLPQYENGPLQTVRRPYRNERGHEGRGVQHRTLLAVPCDCRAGQGAERRVLILGAAHYLLNQHITGTFEARAAELFTSVFSAGQKLALTGHDHAH